MNFFYELDPNDRIDAANFCTFLSMNFAKHYFALYYANLVKNTEDVEDVTRAIGTNPLDKNDLEGYELVDEPALWAMYPKLYEKIMGEVNVDDDVDADELD